MTENVIFDAKLRLAIANIEAIQRGAKVSIEYTRSCQLDVVRNSLITMQDNLTAARRIIQEKLS